MFDFIVKNKIVLIAGIVIAVTVGSCVRGCGSGGDDGDEAEVSRRLGAGRKVIRTPKKYRRAEKSSRAYRADKEHRVAEVKLLDEDTGEVDNGQYDDFHGRDRDIAMVMDTAFWDDDMTNTLAAAMEAANSKNDELREKAVELAAWYGKDGMETLMMFMADPNEEIAESAREAWVEGLREIDDDDDRAAMVAPLAKIMTDPDMVDGMLMALNDLPNIAQMQVVVDIIDTGTEEAYKVALDHYEFMTGEEFTTLEAAQAWVNETWEEEEDDRQEAIVNSAEVDVDTAIMDAGLDKDKVLKAMTDEANELGMSEEEYFKALDEKAEENGMTRSEYIAEMMGDNPDLKAQLESEPESEQPESDQPEQSESEQPESDQPESDQPESESERLP